MEIMGVAEISAHAGVRPDTVHKWRTRGILPPPDWKLAMGDVWRRETIEEWLASRRREG